MRRLADYFQVGGHGFEYFPYGEALDAGEFCDGTRAAYFTGIPDSALASALVFLDPDNGIEPGAATGRNSHKYVKLSELKSLYDRMDRKSVLAVYQHLPRIHRRVFLYYNAFWRLQQALRCPVPLSISDGQIAFLFVAKTKTGRG